MPVRTGEQYLAGLRDQPREIHHRGQKVEDVTTFPGLANGARSIAGLYDMQHDPKIRDEMTYTSPTTGDPVGLSFIAPRNLEDLQRRRTMMSHWAHTSYGMMGRTPDFLNVSIMAMAEAGDYFAQSRPEFKQNIIDYYDYIRENDLTLTHTLVNLQRNRRPAASTQNYSTDVALAVVKETDAGIVVRGPRVLATLGPLSDEIAVYPVRNAQLEGTEDAWRYAFAFAIPCGTPGLRFLCRESFDLDRSNFDHPLGSRFEEMDAIIFMDDVFVPWERVFLYRDVDLANNLSPRTHQYNHSGHQVAQLAIFQHVDGVGRQQPTVQGQMDHLDVETFRVLIHRFSGIGQHLRRHLGVDGRSQFRVVRYLGQCKVSRQSQLLAEGCQELRRRDQTAQQAAGDFPRTWLAAFKAGQFVLQGC